MPQRRPGWSGACARSCPQKPVSFCPVALAPRGAALARVARGGAPAPGSPRLEGGWWTPAPGEGRRLSLGNEEKPLQFSGRTGSPSHLRTWHRQRVSRKQTGGWVAREAQRPVRQVREPKSGRAPAPPASSLSLSGSARPGATSAPRGPAPSSRNDRHAPHAGRRLGFSFRKNTTATRIRGIRRKRVWKASGLSARRLS